MEKFISLIAEVLDKEASEIESDDDFRKYDEWDSLATLALMAMINEEYDITISRVDFEKINSVQALFDKIIKETGA